MSSSARKKARRPRWGTAGHWKDPAMTDFRADGTIMGLAGLTAVFGMGTGGAPPVSSPELGRGAVRPRRPRWFDPVSGHARFGANAAWVVAIRSSDAGPDGSGVVVGMGLLGPPRPA